MEEKAFEVSIPTCSNVAADIIKNSTIVEEGPRICPLCNSIVRIFYIHYTAKILMCENMQCEYPFGDELKIYESDDDGYFISEIDISRFNKSKRNSQASQKSSRRSSCLSANQSQGTGSEVSTSEWSDIAQLNQAYDSDNSLNSNLFTKKTSRLHMEKRVRKQENEEQIKQNVEQIKELNKKLFDNTETLDTIRNEKWIKNLSSMQSSSGMRLVKDQELQKLKTNNQNIDIGELKIDIESRQDSMSSIKIEIGNR